MASTIPHDARLQAAKSYYTVVPIIMRSVSVDYGEIESKRPMSAEGRTYTINLLVNTL